MPPFVSYPPVIRCVPRGVMGGGDGAGSCDTSSESSFASSCSSMSNFRGGPPQKFRRRYPTRAAAKKAVTSMTGGAGTSGLVSGGSNLSRGGDGSTGSSAHSGFVSPIVDSFKNLGAMGNQLGVTKGGTLVASSDSLMDLVTESLNAASANNSPSNVNNNNLSMNPTTITMMSSVGNRGLNSSSSASNSGANYVNTSTGGGIGGGQSTQHSSVSPTNTRSGRSSRLAAPSSGAVGGNKRKQQAPDEKENKRC